MTIWPRSLQAQLAMWLTGVILIATGIGVCALLYESTQAVDTLRRQELTQRAAQLAQSIVRDTDGTVQVALSAKLEQVYHAPADTDLFVIRSEDGRTLAASRSELASLAGVQLGGAVPRYYHLKQFGPTGQDYCAITVRADTVAGPLSVTVARALDADALAHTLLKEFMYDIAWAIPLFAMTMLVAGIWGIRRGLQPVLVASERAATIAPTSTGVRLPTHRIPTELIPLVVTINQALDRLEHGIVAQRQFTANAAHQLRTPLAILTAELDEFKDGPQVAKLRSDAARMNRLIDQLLCVARLDAVPIEVAASVDLNAIAAETVKYLAPWAIAQDRAIGVDAPNRPVWVHGNADALADALRNLVENAVYHTPPKTEVAVSVSLDGTVRVVDHGPGVASEDRWRIFERFWRGRAAKTPGAGLGLAIVAEIAKAHGGTIEVDGSRGGGAKFTLRLRTV